MLRMGKGDVIINVRRKTGLSARVSKQAVNAVFETIQDAMERGVNVAIPNVGVLKFTDDKQPYILKLTPTFIKSWR